MKKPPAQPASQAAAAAGAQPTAPPTGPPPSSVQLRSPAQKTAEVKMVWRHNLDAEFRALRKAITTHRFVAMDVEFPGVVARSIGGPDTLYENVRCNVDLLSPIQVAFALANEQGASPVTDAGEVVAAWQFNFSFSLSTDMYATSSIELLERAGCKFDHHLHHGIEPLAFGELLVSSGLVLDEDVTWVVFHAGFTLANMLKLATNKDMPATALLFYEQTRLFMPTLYDTRHVIARLKSGKWTGGLDALAKELGVERCGAPCQSASDALLNLNVFFALCQRYFPGGLSSLAHANSVPGIVYGLDPKSDSAGGGTGALKAISTSPLFAPTEAMGEISPFEMASQYASAAAAAASSSSSAGEKRLYSANSASSVGR